jgi:hypothetical protein
VLKEGNIRAGYAGFIASCRAGDGYSLTPGAPVSPYALCFAIFGWQLLRQDEVLTTHRQLWDRELRNGLATFRARRLVTHSTLVRDKAYLQLLTFTLSSLAILDTLREDPLEEQVCALLPDDLGSELAESGVFVGRPRSGNHAMFMAILLCHAQQYLGHDTTAQLEQWVRLHSVARNQLGFWGNSRGMTHLQFQNGYHQYEILKYLGIHNWDWEVPADAVASLADMDGQFAPYPGGGGCYDYDAIFMLTGGQATAERHRLLLERTAATLQRNRNPDGGFCESHNIRPRNRRNWGTAWSHIVRGRGPARWERLRQFLSLQRSRHDRVRNHWTEEPYDWSSSDLWNSWFRMLTLARIESAFEPTLFTRWGFINYPSIGYHHSLRVEG